MSGVKDITSDLDRLDDQLDTLEDSLKPLLTQLQQLSSQLPLLDKAKLFSLTAYSIESLLFSHLKLQGADAQNHAVFAELKRVQQYFGKIKAIEEPESQRSTTVNQEAAARILKSDLSDNKSIRNKLTEKIAGERAKALLKSVENRKRGPDDSSAPGSADEQGSGKKRNTRQKKGSRK